MKTMPPTPSGWEDYANKVKDILGICVLTPAQAHALMQRYIHSTDVKQAAKEVIK